MTNNISRRRFIKGCACGGLVIAAGTIPRLAAATGAKVNIGPMTRYSVDGVWSDFATDGFLLVRVGGKLRALSNICTHRSGVVVSDGGTQLKCTRHKGFFDLQGNPAAGPPDEPLVEYSIITQADGTAVVDTERIVPNNLIE